MCPCKLPQSLMINKRYPVGCRFAPTNGTAETPPCKLHLPVLATIQVQRTVIPAGTATDFGFGLVETIGYQYNITFHCANGNLPTLGCITDGTSPFTSTNPDEDALTPPDGRQCQVTTEIDGSFVSGDFTLSTTYPHSREGTPVAYPTTASLSWRATADDVDTALEDIRDTDNTRVFGAVTVERHVYWPPGEIRWSGQYNWSVTFDTRPGDVPEMTSTSTMVTNDGTGAALSVGTARDGNEIDGGFGLSFCPNGEDCVDTADSYFGAFLTENEFKRRFSEAFFTRGDVNILAVAGTGDVRANYTAATDSTIDVSDWLRLDGNDYTVTGVIESTAPADGYEYTVELNENVATLSGGDGAYSATFGTSAVTVTRTGPTQAMGYSWEVTFSNKTVGGNQPDVGSPAANLTGSGANIVVSETQQGNQLTGTFTLSYDGGCLSRPSAVLRA